jgi:transposase InsO family protein
MDLHANAALSLNKRRLLAQRVVEDEWTLTKAAAAAEVSVRCARKWVTRYRRDGEIGLLDRSSAPASVANRTSEERIQLIASLRRLRFTGITGIKRNPGRTRVDAAGVERKVIGWEFVHVAIDDCTRLAYAEVLPDEKATTAIAFLRRAVAFFERHGIAVERLLTDNGSAYRSTVHAIACRALGIRHLRTRPYRPQTNGKAERFIRTLQGGWAYGAIYRTSSERTAALDGWLWHYNHQRRHSALGHQPPIARLTERTNLLGTYT